MLKYIPICLCLLACMGCDSDSGPRTVEASGVVTLDGAPIDKAQVIFIQSATQDSASATTDAQGRFSLMHRGEKKGAVPGSYQVQVSKTLLEGGSDGSADVTILHGLPKQYASIVTSQLTFTVPESGTSDIKLDLLSK